MSSSPGRLSLLGNARLHSGDAVGESHVVLASGKPLAVITYLHCTPAQAVSREQLLELLWSDADPDRGRHTLRQTFWYVRKKLGEDPFATLGESVRLATPIPSDREDFLAALDADDLDTALEHYGGDFFPDFAAPGGAGFEHWADLERSRLRALFLGAATRVVRDRLSKGHARDAITIARRTQSLAPHHQAAWRLLLESYLAAEDSIGAAVELDRLERWLADDELEPDASTAQLMKAVRSGKASGNGRTTRDAAESTSLQAELVGRESEFAELLTAFETTKRGQSRHVHISAPAGFGKTRLLDGFAARLRSTRVRVITVRATPAERSLPYAFAAQLVSALVPLRGASAVSPDSARTLIALAPAASSYLNAEPDRSAGSEALRRRLLAVTELVNTIAHDAPLVVLVDDVHWMDVQSRTLLASLAVRLGAAPVLLVSSARSADRFVEDTPTAQRLMLRPLSTDDVGALVMSIGQLPDEPWAEGLVSGLHTTSAGSPLLVLETLQLVMERDQLRLAGQMWSTPDATTLIETLGAGRAMQQRLAALPPAARDALLRLAVAGTTVSDSTLPSLLSQDGRESLTLLDTRGLVARSDDSVRVAHDEIAALTIEMASDSDRVRANEAMASHLERVAGNDVSLWLRAAWHRARASDTGALDRTFARAVHRAHLHGEQAAIHELGREVLGASAADAEIDSLVKRLPWRTRYNPRRWAGRLALTTIVLLLAVAIVVFRTGVVPGADLTATLIATSAEGPAFFTLTVRDGELSLKDPIDLTPTGDAFPLSVLDSVNVTGRLNSGAFVGSSLLVNGGRNAIELVRVSSTGDVMPLLELPHDQDGATSSPDGRLVAFTNGDRHPDQRTELEILELASGKTTRLTESDGSEFSQRWNADGTRIAFIRSHATARQAQVCHIGVDKSNETCRVLGTGFVPTRVVGWISDHALLVSARRTLGSQPLLLNVDMDSGEPIALDSSATIYIADPTGRLVLCLCALPEFGGRVLAVFSPLSPRTKRVVRWDGRPVRDFNASFVRWEKPSSGLKSVAVTSPSEAFVGQRLQLGISGLDSSREERGVLATAWTSLDTNIAVVDTLGVALMRAEGDARFVVDAGHIRSDERTVRVQPPTSDVVLREDWSGPMSNQWVLFGSPLPTVVFNQGHASLSLNGDDHLNSGVVGRRTIKVETGAGVQVHVRTPIDIAQWQALSVALDPVTSNDALAEWSERNRTEGLFPTSWNAARIGRACMFRIPRAEGGENLGLIAFFSGQQEVPILVTPPRMTDASQHTVTIQVLGDGRCGLAIDGTVVAVSSNAIKTDRPLRVILDGQAVGTKIKVDDVEAWSGIRPGIDWGAALPPASPRRP